MNNYIAQCGHEVDINHNFCRQCGKKIIRIWNKNDYTGEECKERIELFNKKVHILPDEIYKKEFIEQNREIDILYNCFEWYDNNPDATDDEINNFIRQSIIDRFNKEKTLSKNNKLNYLSERCNLP